MLGGRTFIVTGQSHRRHVADARACAQGVPGTNVFVVGGGIDDKNVATVLQRADRVIVGTYLHDQTRPGRVDVDRAGRLSRAARTT